MSRLRDDQIRGAVLYGIAALLLLGGGTWWVRAAPHDEADPQLARWRQTAEQMLPNAENQVEAQTLVLPSGADHDVSTSAEVGRFIVSVVCVGGPDSRIRVSLGEAGTDTGRGLACSETGMTDTFRVSSGGELQLHVTVNDSGAVAFGYSLLPAQD